MNKHVSSGLCSWQVAAAYPGTGASNGWADTIAAFFSAPAGCTAHWLRLTELEENPNAPALFDYTWNGDRWESSGDYPFHCNDGSAVTAFRSDFLRPNGDGSFAGERTFTVAEPGCPGDGPGTYWLPFRLTPSP